MNGWFNPDNWIDLVSQLMLVVGGLCIAIVPSWFAARSHKFIKEVSDSVNQRPTSLRDDLDKAITGVETLGHDVRGLRQDVTAMDDMRRQQIADLRAELDHRTGRRKP